jgi:hypothetical protein
MQKRQIREKRQLEVIADLQTPDTGPGSSKEPSSFFDSGN